MKPERSEPVRSLPAGRLARVWARWDRVCDWADRETTAYPMRWPGRLLIVAGGLAVAGFLVLVVLLAVAFASLAGAS